MKFRLFILLFLQNMLAFAQTDVNDGLIGYYPFNGNGNDYQCGFPSGTACYTANFTLQNTYSFVGDKLNNGGAALQLGNSQMLSDFDATKYVFNLYGQFSLSFLVKLDNFTSPSIHVPILFANNTSIYDIRLSANQIQFNAGSTTLNANTTITQGQWYHVAVTHNNSTIKLYLNGQEVAQGTGTLSNSFGSQHRMFIGGGATVYENFSFNGAIDELRIYNKAISADAVQQLNALNYITPFINTQSVCLGSQTNTTLPISFVALGNFTTNNSFNVQLSNSSGSFSPATSIGSVSNAGSGAYNTTLTIPSNTPLSNNYRIRVISTELNSIEGKNSIPTKLISKPDATITSNSPIASGSNATLTVTTLSGLPYMGMLTYTNLDNSGSGYVNNYGVSSSPFSMTVTPTKSANYSFEMQNSCGSTTVNTNVIVDCGVTPTANNAAICTGQSAILTASGCTGSTYKWYSSATGTTILASNPSYTTPTLTSTNTYYVSCTTTNNCESIRIPVVVTVNSIPTTPTVATPNPICLGQTATLTSSGCSGTVKWTGGLLGSSISVSPSTTRNYRAACVQNSCSSDSSVAVSLVVNTILPTAPTVSIPVCSNTATKVWEKRWGGTDHEDIYSVAELADGGLLWGGFSNSLTVGGDKTIVNYNSSADGWYLKTTSNGQTKLWDAVLGGSGLDYITHTLATSDGGAMISLYSGSAQNTGNKTAPSYGDVDAWIVKVNASGAIEKQWSFGGSAFDAVYGLIQTADGNYVALIQSNSLANTGNKSNDAPNRGGYDIWLVKFNPNLPVNNCIIWQKTFGGAADENLFGSLLGSTILEMPDGDLVIGTHSGSAQNTGNKTTPLYGGFDYWVFRISPDATSIRWQQSFGGSAGDILYGIINSRTQNNLVLVGQTDSGISGNKTSAPLGGTDAWLVEINALTGTKVFEKVFGGAIDDIATGVLQGVNDGYFLSVMTNSGANSGESPALGGWDMRTLKLDNNFSMVWDRRDGGANNEYLKGIIRTRDLATLLIGTQLTSTTAASQEYYGVKISECTATNSANICSGQPVNIHATGCNGVVNWSNGMTGTAITVSTAGTYTATCTPTGSICPSAASSPITINNITPASPTVSNVLPVCSGLTASLSASGCNGSYKWYGLLSSSTVLGTTANFTTPMLSTSTTYYVSCTENSCESSRTAAAVTVKQSPVLTLTPAVPCQGDDVTLTISQVADSGLTITKRDCEACYNITNVTFNGLSKFIRHQDIYGYEGMYSVVSSITQCTSNTVNLFPMPCHPQVDFVVRDKNLNNHFTNANYDPISFSSHITSSVLDENDNIYVKGYFTDSLIIAQDTIVSIYKGPFVSPNGVYQGYLRTSFIAKFDKNGNKKWLKKLTAEYGEDVQSRITYENGKLYVSGNFQDASNTDSDINYKNKFGRFIIQNENGSEVFSYSNWCTYNSAPNTRYYDRGAYMWIARFDSTGNFDYHTKLTENNPCATNINDHRTTPNEIVPFDLEIRNDNLWILPYNITLLYGRQFKFNNAYSVNAKGAVLAKINKDNGMVVKTESIAYTSNSSDVRFSYSMKIDSQNNIILFSSNGDNNSGYASSINFGATALNFQRIELFLAKYNEINGWLWFQKTTNLAENIYNINTLAIDREDNIIVQIKVIPSTQLSFAGLAQQIVPNACSDAQVALIKVSSTGQGLWLNIVQSLYIHSNSRYPASDILIDNQNNILLLGSSQNATCNSSSPDWYNKHRSNNDSYFDYAGGLYKQGLSFYLYKPNGDLLKMFSNMQAANLNGSSFANVSMLVNSQNKIILTGSFIRDILIGNQIYSNRFSDIRSTNYYTEQFFLTSLSNPLGIVLRDVTLPSAEICGNQQIQVSFDTHGTFAPNTKFKVQLIKGNHDAFYSYGESSTSPITISVPDSILTFNTPENKFYVRVITTDDKVIGTHNITKFVTAKKNPTVSVLSGSNQNSVCLSAAAYAQLYGSYQSAATPPTFEWKRDNTVIGSNSHIYNITGLNDTGNFTLKVTDGNCSTISTPFLFSVVQPSSASISGNFTISQGQSANVPITLTGGFPYNVTLSDGQQKIVNANSTIFSVSPISTTTYTLTSLSNACGSGSVSGSALVTLSLCPSNLTLLNPADNITSGIVEKRASATTGSINASNIIVGVGTRATYLSKTIILSPGFKADNGTVFNAQIGGCN